ncbi:conserved hypothetical protein [Treponema phagedenis]|uniref:Uncharacterized protein n=1 Tax=Treponema phagedenis TaxID=162 RepID=A0A0B7H1A0_TREPH|nr:conserved hypothetical protein [Treponema phagedenis]
MHAQTPSKLELNPEELTYLESLVVYEQSKHKRLRVHEYFCLKARGCPLRKQPTR